MPSLPLTKATSGVRFAPSATRGLRAAAGPPTSYDPATRTFEACLASEKPCRTYRWAARGWDLIEVEQVLPMAGLVEIAKLRGAALLTAAERFDRLDAEAAHEAVLSALAGERRRAEEAGRVAHALRDRVARDAGTGHGRANE